MASTSKIEWTDATWNPITGCSMVSAGCTNCYAMRLAGSRLKNHPSRRGLTRPTAKGPTWTGDVRFNDQWLDQPLRWTRPRMVFVCAHSDLFHEDVPEEWIDRIFSVMALAPEHTFQLLTKRPGRMRRYLKRLHGEPFHNVWLGVSAEDQVTADERIPTLLGTPAAVRWLSAEPLLGPIDLTPWMELDWVVCGGESGPGFRPMDAGWAAALKRQCQSAEVPFFMKQMSGKADIPAGLLVREYPVE